MMKVTQKELKQMAQTMYAEDVTNISTKQFIEVSEEENGCFDTIAYSHGIYGCTGKLLRGYVTGKLYVITRRSTALFMF